MNKTLHITTRCKIKIFPFQNINYSLKVLNVYVHNNKSYISSNYKILKYYYTNYYHQRKIYKLISGLFTDNFKAPKFLHIK